MLHDDRRLTERRQPYQVLARHRLERLSRLTPGSESTHDDERVESFFPQHVRHPGACAFAHSSAVQIDIPTLG